MFVIKYRNFDARREWKKNLFLVKRDDEVDCWGGSRTGKLRREKKMSKSETRGIVLFQFVRYTKLSLFVTQNWRDIPSDEIKLFCVLSCDNNIFATNRKSYIALRTWLALFLPMYKDKVASLNVKDKKSPARAQFNFTAWLQSYKERV